jgi:hypothetical protein
MPCKHVVESCSTIASKCIHTSYRFRWCEYSSLQNETVIEEKDKEKKSLDESLTILQGEHSPYHWLHVQHQSTHYLFCCRGSGPSTGKICKN